MVYGTELATKEAIIAYVELILTGEWKLDV
jgi:hypothetical protein